MKKHRLHDIALGMVIMALLMGLAAPAFATVATKTLEAHYMDIKLVVDGVEVIPKDVNGNVVEPFTINGTTFLPVRAVASALGKEVTWDNNTKTVYLGEVPAGAIKDWVGTRPLEDLTGGWHDTYSVKDNPAVAAVIKETNAEVNKSNGDLGIRPADAHVTNSIWLEIHDHDDYSDEKDGRLEYWLYGLGGYISAFDYDSETPGYLKVVKVLLNEIVSDNDDVEAIYETLKREQDGWTAGYELYKAGKTGDTIYWTANYDMIKPGIQEFNTVVVEWVCTDYGNLDYLKIYNKLP